MMAIFYSKDDLYFLVYFSLDKSVHLLPKKRISFNEDESELSVKVLFQTSNLQDDGTEVIEDLPYDGKIFFSGSQIKCKNVQKRVQSEVNLTESSAFDSLLDLAKEIKQCGGKRGASVRLKRVLEEESRDIVKRAKKKKQTNNDAEQKKENGKPQSIKSKSKLSVQKALRLREAIAFAGTTPTTETTNTIENNKRGSEKTPEKTSISLETNTSISKTKTPHKTKTPEKKSLFRNTHITNIEDKFSTPEKTAQKKIITPRKSPRASRKSDISPKKTKTPQKYSTPMKCKTLSKSPKRILETETAIASTSWAISEGLHTLNYNEETDTDFQVSHSVLNHNYPEDESEVNTDLVQTLDQQLHQVQPEFGYNTRAYYETNTFVGNSTTQPLYNVIDYFRSLDHEQKTNVLGFLNVLASDLHSHIFQYSGGDGGNSEFSLKAQSSESSLFPSTQILNVQNDVNGASPELKERKVSLIIDPQSIFKDVMVNPAKLRTAEMKAMTASVPAVFLLNKLAELLFTKEELLSSKGVKGLDSHRMAALQEYMHSRCKSLNIEQVAPKVFMQTLQNKIGNLRYRNSGKKTSLKKKCTSVNS